MAFLPPSDSGAVFALLALLGDPEAYKARLTELQKMSDDVLARVQNTADLSVEAQSDRDEAAKKLAQAQNSLDEVQRMARDKDAAFAVREQTVSKREDEVSKREVDNAEYGAELDQEQKDLDTASVQLAKMTQEAIAREADARAVTQEYQDKLQKLRAMV